MPSKRVLKYEEMTDYLEEQIPAIELWQPDVLAPVLRGGLTISHWLGRRLNLPIYPLSLDRLENDVKHLTTKYQAILVLEDVIAQGRTFSLISDAFKKAEKWGYFPFITDNDWLANIPFKERHILDNLTFTTLVTGDWIVFPWEEESKVKIGDRGLFRDNTHFYGG